jgi:cephalosporin-C deacetylase
MQPLTNNQQTFLCTWFFILFPYFLIAQMTVKADRQTAKYAIGESATFVVKQANDGTANYSIKYAQSSDLVALSTGTVQISGGQGFISYTATAAGFVHCVVTQNGQTSYGGAAFDPFTIQPAEPEPADFDAYWNAQKAALSAVPLSPNVYYRSETQYVNLYNYDIGLTDGKRAYGYISVPKGAGSYPAIIELPPYGNSANIVGDDGSLAERGGVIAVKLNIHNNQPSQSGPNSYLDINLTDPNNYYLKYAILGVIKTIDYLQTRADFNKQVGVIGLSQGGGLALLAAGIDNRISLLVNAYPALCAHPALKYNKPSGFPSFWKVAQTLGLEPNTVLKTVKYYDAVTAAKRFKGVSWSMIAYRDDICYPATCFEAYNQLKGQKILTHLINNTHSNNPEEYFTPNFPVGIYALLRRHFPKANDAPWPYITKTMGYSIDAGNDVNSQNNSILLRGAILLETAAANYPVRWEKVEGIGTVNFDNPNALTTNATFSQNGVYRLRLIAEDMSTLTNEPKYTTLSDDIIVTIGNAIPIELIDFKGELTKNGTLLSWTTASERANKSFEIERSVDAKDWQTIAQLNGKNNSNSLNKYAFNDEIYFPIVYYRLKQIDFNGTFNYSKTISFVRNKAITIDVFPNPVSKELTVKINDFVNKMDVKIVDISGKLWLTKTFYANQNALNVTYLPSGKYFIHVNYNAEGIVIKSFIKE